MNIIVGRHFLQLLGVRPNVLVLVRTVGTSPTAQPAAPMPIAAIQPA